MIVDRRHLLKCGGGLVAASLAPALVTGACAQTIEPDDEDDPGCDLEAEEKALVAPRLLTNYTKPPPRFVVNPEFLPPVGNQGSVGACVAWAAGYGLTTAMLARKLKRDPSLPAHQVSASYFYSTVRNAMASGCSVERDKIQCDGQKHSTLGKGGTNIPLALTLLAEFGSVSAQDCPYPLVQIGGRRVVSGALYDNVYAAWGSVRVEPTIKIASFKEIVTHWERPNDLNNIKAVLAQNEPLVLSLRLPDKWGSARFDQSGKPWEHYRNIQLKNKNANTPAGHAMLVIGYDDNVESAGGNRGAMLLQNSWGNAWGMSWSDAFKTQYPNLPVKPTKGYVWITYEAFRVLAKRIYSVEV